MTTFNIDQQDFKQWLESYAPKSRVGYTGEPRKCPIGKYLTKKGYDVYFVGASTIEIRNPGIVQSVTPDWASKFVMAIDDLYEGKWADHNYSVSAKTALKVFNEVCPIPTAKKTQRRKTG